MREPFDILGHWPTVAPRKPNSVTQEVGTTLKSQNPGTLLRHPTQVLQQIFSTCSHFFKNLRGRAGVQGTYPCMTGSTAHGAAEVLLERVHGNGGVAA